MERCNMRVCAVLAMILIAVFLTPSWDAVCFAEATEAPETELNEESAAEESDEGGSGGLFDPWFSAQTSIAYSSGSDSDWAYGNQRKEFPITTPCYVRVANSIVAEWHWGWFYGEGTEITITYKFTGTENCTVEVADGFLTQVETDEPNTIVYTRTLTAKKSHEEDVVIFRYDPIQVGSISLEVIYDENVDPQYDELNTAYFVEEEW